MAVKVYAENLPYWKSGQSSPDSWMEKTVEEIRRAGGQVLADASINELGRAAYMIKFAFGNDVFVAVEPVIESKSGDERSAKRQAATTLHHEIKARCVTARRRGARWAFLQYLMLPDGRQVGQAATPELSEMWPKMLTVEK